MTLHILEDRHKVVRWRFVINYMRTPLTLYFLESTEQAAYMETHPKQIVRFLSSAQFKE